MLRQGVEYDPELRRLHRVKEDSKKQQIDGLNDVLPNELLKKIFCQVRASDLVSVADSFPRLEPVVRYQPNWRETTVRVCGDDVTIPIRQLQLASALKELQIGLGQLSPEAANAICKYDGPVPLIPSLRIRLSVLGQELGAFLLQKFGRDMEYLDLDLRLGPQEPPRCNEAVILSLTQFSKLERLAIRIDNVTDLVTLAQISTQTIKPIEVDISSLRVSDGVAAGPGPDAGTLAGQFLIFKNKDIMILRLSPTFHNNVATGTFECKEVRTLVCDIWTVTAVTPLIHLQSLHLYYPDEPFTYANVQRLSTFTNNSTFIFSKIRDLRFINRCGTGLTWRLASNEAPSLAILKVFFLSCKKADIIILEWPLRDSKNCYRNWMDDLLDCQLGQLRELRLGGNLPSARHLLSLPAKCPSLEILDIRLSPRTTWPGIRPTITTVTSGIVGMKRAMELVQWALPKLTILFDDDAENYYDWNFYRDCTPGKNPEGAVQVLNYAEVRKPLCRFISYTDHRYFMDIYGSVGFHYRENDEHDFSLYITNALFEHMQTFQTWVHTQFGFRIITAVDYEFWQCATLDFSLWHRASFCKVLYLAGALGMVDCRNNTFGYEPEEQNNTHWMRSLENGPTKIRGLRIRAGMVPPDLWHLMAVVLRRVGDSLERLELDFRGSTNHEWRRVLCALIATPKITEFALRGSCDDEQPLMDWLYGRLPSVKRLDLRDCQMSRPDQTAPFAESFVRLLEQVGGNLSALALPILSKDDSADALCLVAQLTHLSEIALHVSQLWSIWSFKSLSILIVYGDKKPSDNEGLARRLVSSIRQLSDVLRNVVSFTLPSELYERQIVQDAILDAMPWLEKLHVIHPDGKVKTCVEGPRCKDRAVWCPPS